MKFKDKIYRDLVLVLKMCVVVMAFLGVFYTFFYKPITLEDIKLVEINGNTQSEYILEIDGEYHLYQNDRRKYQIYYLDRFERLLKNLCPFDEDFLHETELVLDSLHISLDLPCQD